MIPANDIVKRIEEIKYYVSVANFDAALKRLIDLTRDFCQDQENTALLISSTYYVVYQSELNGVIDFKEAVKEKNGVALRILNTLQCCRLWYTTNRPTSRLHRTLRPSHAEGAVKESYGAKK